MLFGSWCFVGRLKWRRALAFIDEEKNRKGGNLNYYRERQLAPCCGTLLWGSWWNWKLDSWKGGDMEGGFHEDSGGRERGGGDLDLISVYCSM